MNGGGVQGELGQETQARAVGGEARGPDPLWLRQGPYYWDGPGGTRISASLVGAGPEPGWRYSAWGAEACPELNYWQWRKQVGSMERAKRGQALPQRRSWLGVYLTASEARGACLAWLAGQEREATPVQAADEPVEAVNGMDAGLGSGDE